MRQSEMFLMVSMCIYSLDLILSCFLATSLPTALQSTSLPIPLTFTLNLMSSVWGWIKSGKSNIFYKWFIQGKEQRSETTHTSVEVGNQPETLHIFWVAYECVSECVEYV